MDGSRVTQSLDFLWFYTNVLTFTHYPVPSLTHQCSSSSIHGNDPNTQFIVNQLQHHDESQHAEDLSLTSRCLKCGEISSSAFEDERVMMMHGNSGMKSGKETKKRERRKRRKKLNFIGGVDGKKVNEFLKLQDYESYEYDDDEMIKTTKLPPFDDDVAMKQHLKSWAYAVACTVK